MKAILAGFLLLSPFAAMAGEYTYLGTTGYVEISYRRLSGAGHADGEVVLRVTNSSSDTLEVEFRVVFVCQYGPEDRKTTTSITLHAGQTMQGELSGLWYIPKCDKSFSTGIRLEDIKQRRHQASAERPAPTVIPAVFTPARHYPSFVWAGYVDEKCPDCRRNCSLDAQRCWNACPPGPPDTMILGPEWSEMQQQHRTCMTECSGQENICMAPCSVCDRIERQRARDNTPGVGPKALAPAELEQCQRRQDSCASDCYQEGKECMDTCASDAKACGNRCSTWQDKAIDANSKNNSESLLRYNAEADRIESSTTRCYLGCNNINTGCTMDCKDSNGRNVCRDRCAISIPCGGS